MKFIAKTYSGLEELLAEELHGLGASAIELHDKAVHFTAKPEFITLANVHLRTALAILIPICSFRFASYADLIRKIEREKLHQYLTAGKTFAFKGSVKSSQIRGEKNFLPELEEKITNEFTDQTGETISANQDKPAVLLDFFITEQECTISRNSSGAPLYQRGYRSHSGNPNLNEIISAALVLLSGWDKKSHFIHAGCEKGTVIAEAALIANDIPALINRKTFAFKNWPGFDEIQWQNKLEALPKIPVKNPPFEITGLNLEADDVKDARENLRPLPVGKSVKIEAIRLDELTPTGNGIVLFTFTLKEDPRLEPEQKSSLVNLLQNKFHSYTLCVYQLDEMEDIFEVFKPVKSHRFFNGTVWCRFTCYQIPSPEKKESTNSTINTRRQPKRFEKNKK